MIKQQIHTPRHKNRPGRPFFYTVALLLLVFFGTSCGKKPQESPAPSSSVEKDGATPSRSATDGGEASSAGALPGGQQTSGPESSDTALKDSEEGSFRVRIRNEEIARDRAEEEQELKVRTDTDNIVIRERLADDSQSAETSGKQSSGRKKQWIRQTPIPEKSLAFRIPVPEDREILWSPDWIHQNAGFIRIPDVQLSADRSLFAFVETTGASRGPYGSRIVLMNAHSWRIAEILEIPGRKINGIAFLPAGKPALAALCARQPEKEQPCGIAIIDLLNGGKETQFIPLKDAKGLKICADGSGKYVCVLFPEARTMLIFNAADFSASPERLKLQSDSPCSAVFSGDGAKLAVAGKDCLEIFKTEPFAPLTSQKLPKGFVPGKLCFLNRDNALVLFADSDRAGSSQESLLFHNGALSRFAPNSSGTGTVDEKNKLIYVGIRHGGKIQVFLFPALEETDSDSPERIQPKTTGDPEHLFYIPSNDSIAVFDVSGNFYLLYRYGKEKHFRKDLLFRNSLK